MTKRSRRSTVGESLKLNPVKIAPIPIEARFDNPEALAYYSRRGITLKILEERGINLEGLNPEIGIEIERRSWGNLFRTPISANVSMVKEIFSTIAKSPNGVSVVKVRGVPVDISPARINALYSIPSIPPENDYTIWLTTGLDIAERARRYLAPNSPWNTTSTGVRTNFSIRHFDVDTKLWHRFLGNRVCPSTTTTTCNHEMAILLYSVLVGYPVDIGRFIYHYLLGIAKGEKPRSIPFPSLLTHLCLDSLVSVYTDDIYKGTPVDFCASSFPPPVPEPTQPSGAQEREKLFMIDVYQGMESQRGWMESIRQGIIGQRALSDELARSANFQTGEYARVSADPFIYQPWVMPGAPFFRAPDPQDQAPRDGLVLDEHEDDDDMELIS